MINRNNLNLKMELRGPLSVIPHTTTTERTSRTTAIKRSKIRAIYLLAVFLGGSIGLITLKTHRSSKTVTALEAKAIPTPEKETVTPTASGSVETLIAAAADQKDQSQSGTAGSNALSSSAILPAGETSLKICYDQLSPTSQVYLTETQRTQGSENVILFVKKKVPFNPETGDCSHFVAALPRPVDYDLEFNWLVIN